MSMMWRLHEKHRTTRPRAKRVGVVAIVAMAMATSACVSFNDAWYAPVASPGTDLGNYREISGKDCADDAVKNTAIVAVEEGVFIEVAVVPDSDVDNAGYLFEDGVKIFVNYIANDRVTLSDHEARIKVNGVWTRRLDAKVDDQFAAPATYHQFSLLTRNRSYLNYKEPLAFTSLEYETSHDWPSEVIVEVPTLVLAERSITPPPVTFRRQVSDAPLSRCDS